MLSLQGKLVINGPALFTPVLVFQLLNAVILCLRKKVLQMEETLHNFVAFVLGVTKFPVLPINLTLGKGNLFVS